MNSQCWCPAERFHSFIRVTRSGFLSFLFFLSLFHKYLFEFWLHCSQKKKKMPKTLVSPIQVSTPNQCRKKNGTKVPLVARGDIAGISLFFFFLHPLFTFSTPPSPLLPWLLGKKLAVVVTMGLNTD